MELESCNFVAIYRTGHRRRHAGGTAAASVTAIGGGGGAAAAARVTGCQLGLGRLRGRDELVGQDGIKKCEISQLKA